MVSEKKKTLTFNLEAVYIPAVDYKCKLTKYVKKEAIVYYGYLEEAWTIFVSAGNSDSM